MGLSSNTLLHQTDLEGLKGILNVKGFILRYCREFLNSNFLTPNLAIPMVSFSDIPFSELHKHLQRYGDYTIGMSKTWGIKSKLNPVLYMEEKSVFTERIVEQFDFHMQLYFQDLENDEARKRFYFFIFLLAHCKNYEGRLELKKLNKVYDRYRFSDEREWRYVPEVGLIGEDKFYKTLEDYDKNKEEINKAISDTYLPFKLTDINYIIVDSIHEVDTIRNLIEDTDEYKTNRNNININIFTNEQIKTDFL